MVYFRRTTFLLILLFIVTFAAGCVTSRMGVMLSGGATVAFLGDYIKNWEPPEPIQQQQAPTQAPEGLTVSNLSSLGFILSWDEVPTAIAYHVYIDRVLFYEAVLTRQVTFTGLTVGQNYALEVSALNTGGAGPKSAPIVVTIPADSGPAGDNIPPSISLVAPVGGETVTDSLNIAWNALDADGDTVTITVELSTDSGLTWALLATDEPDDGVFPWDSTDVVDGDTFRVRVTAYDGRAIASETSATDFSIDNGITNERPVVTLTAPTGGEVWTGLQEITWTASDPEGEEVTISIFYSSDSGTTWQGEAFNSANDGTHPFDTTFLSDGSRYRVRIVASDGARTAEAASTEDFIINNSGNLPPLVTLTAPNGGETWSGTQNITWTASDPEDEDLTIEILFSSNSGGSYASITSEEDNDGSYSWTITTVGDTTTCRIQVVASDGLATAQDSSEADFTITGGGVGEEVTFPDPILEAAIRDSIAKPAGPIFKNELSVITEIIILREEISDLTGLEHCENLIILDIMSGAVSNISTLSGMTQLTRLRLDGNQISGIEELANLVNLTHLGLGTNQISDISSLSGLTNLITLSLAQNTITDFSLLSGFTSLVELELYSNQITDISFLTPLTNLNILVLFDNQITDISPMLGLTSLTDVWLNSNQITDIETLVDNQGISDGDNIELTFNPLDDTSKNTHIPALEARGVTVSYTE